MARSSVASQMSRTFMRAAIESPLSRAQHTTTACTRSFTSSSSCRVDEAARSKLIAGFLSSERKDMKPTGLATRPPPTRDVPMTELAKVFNPSGFDVAPQDSIGRTLSRSTSNQRQVDVSRFLRSEFDEDIANENDDIKDDDMKSPEPFHFHVYSHRHNTCVTVTRPNREVILSLASGNLGFKHSARGQYDAAYQLGAYAIDKLQQAGWHARIHQLEVVLRGFGQGREAVTKVLLSNEGRLLRDKIVRVSDATRLKHGGTRSRKPRRLG